MSSNRVAMEAMGQDAKRFAEAGARKVIHDVHLGLVGGLGRAPGTPRRTGEATAGWAWGINQPPSYRPPARRTSYPSPPVSVVDDLMRSRFELGDTVHGRNRVPHASILAGGRRFSPRANRMLGSVQAPGQPPRDFVTLSLEEAGQRLASWRHAG